MEPWCHMKTSTDTFMNVYVAGDFRTQALTKLNPLPALFAEEYLLAEMSLH